MTKFAFIPLLSTTTNVFIHYSILETLNHDSVTFVSGQNVRVSLGVVVHVFNLNTQEVEAGLHSEFQVSQSYTVRHCLKQQQQQM